jgi:hypothetical protein
VEYCDSQGEWNSETIVATAGQSVFTASLSLPAYEENISILIRPIGVNTFSKFTPSVYTVDALAGTVTLIGISISAGDEIKIKFHQ